MKRVKSKKYNFRLLLYILSAFTIGLAAYSCKSKEPMTKRLFMQYKRAHLELPPDKVDSEGNALVSESVTYQHEDNRSEVIWKEDSVKKAKTSISEVQHLSEVTVIGTIKQKFTPERDGRVNVDFLIRVPKELLSPDWRLTLSPKLLHNDSIVPLKEVILKGTSFAARQQTDSLAFDAYEKSIIPKSDYDSLFLDRKGIAKDMRERQNIYWKNYDDQLNKIMAYYDWKNQTEERYALYNVRQDGNRQLLYHKYMRKKETKTIRLLIDNIDTTGIDKKYHDKFERQTKLSPRYRLHRELTGNNVPDKYKDLFLNEPRIEDIPNYSTSERDSVEIAKHRYLFRQVAENESKDQRREKVREKIVPFAKEEGYHLDTVADPAQDFLYLYSQEYPVTPGLKGIRIVMEGKVTATDRSGYNLPKSDTLYYFISSLVQLADTSLIVKKTKLYRNMFDRMLIYPQFEPDKADFKVTYRDNRLQVDTLMARYRKLTHEAGFRMDSVEIRSWVSLDGDYDENYELSLNRAESLKEYLQNNHSEDITGAVFNPVPKGEDWQGLVDGLKKRDDIANKDSILAMIGSTVYPDQTELDIKQKYAKDYKIIRDSIYPTLRRMDIIFNVSRPGMAAADSMLYEVKEGYEEGIRLLKNREYWEALQILKDYPDYNAALCLACMGYNGRAYDILVKLPQTGNNEYLLSIVNQRLGKEPEAIENLLKAVELDPLKASRIDLDAEVRDLVNKYGLRRRIEEISRNSAH